MERKVTEVDTAEAVGSGEVSVLATPRLLAWLEAETVRAAAPLLAPGQTTVGTAFRVEHLRATAVGRVVEVTADPPATTGGRRLTFQVRAVDDAGKLVAAGEIDRALVDRERFLTTAYGTSRTHPPEAG